MKRRIALVVFLLLLIAMPFLGMWYSPSVAFKPDFPAITPLLARQQAFIGFMVPKINYANNEILATRTQILNLLLSWQKTGSLSKSDRAWLLEIADVYQVPGFELTNPASVNNLLSRVDMIPVSLILAQAGDESAWGASRIAVFADNFFGQQCYAAGCGIPLLGKKVNFEYQKFNTVQDAVNDYLYNLNTNAAYAEFRATRALLRQNNEALVGFRLVPYLTHYSILGDRYVLRISAIILNQNLMQYDALSTETLD